MRLVLVEWVDSVYHDLWESVGDLEPTDMIVRSVGWLAKDTPDYKTVVPHRESNQVRGGITIPISAVRKIVDLPSS